MELFCQWVLLVLFAIGFLHSTYIDFEGREAKAPGGFGGFVSTCVVHVLLWLVYWKVGVFSLIF